MTEQSLTPEQILDATEEVLRRFGPTKATVIDVARALGVSHGSIYRHFPSKIALREAVAARWLARVSEPLQSIASESGSAKIRLRKWFDALRASKLKKVNNDPEMFATYVSLAAESRAVISAHVAHLTGQIAKIVEDGVKQNEFFVRDPKQMALAIFDATTRFHNPSHAQEWQEPDFQEAFERVWGLILAGLCKQQHQNEI